MECEVGTGSAIAKSRKTWVVVIITATGHSDRIAIDVKADLTSLLLTGLPLSTVLPEHLEHGNQTTERVRISFTAGIPYTLLIYGTRILRSGMLSLEKHSWLLSMHLSLPFLAYSG